MISAAKVRAQSILKYNWIRVVGLMFITFVIELLSGTNLSNLYKRDGSIGFSLLSISSSGGLSFVFLGGLIGSILFFIIVDLIENIKRQEDRGYLTAFLYPFKNWSLLIKGSIIGIFNRILLFSFAITLGIFVFNLLIVSMGGFTASSLISTAVMLLIICISMWLYLGFSQALYILYEEPKLKLRKCIYYSFKMADGNRWWLIGFYLSFYFWFILGALALIVGVFWSMAYFQVSRFEFYHVLKTRTFGSLGLPDEI
jgi:uncharacterized membrane protein